MKKSDIESHVASLTSLSKPAADAAVNAECIAIANTHAKYPACYPAGHGGHQSESARLHSNAWNQAQSHM